VHLRRLLWLLLLLLLLLPSSTSGLLLLSMGSNLAAGGLLRVHTGLLPSCALAAAAAGRERRVLSQHICRPAGQPK
jgi:hypothetical protein